MFKKNLISFKHATYLTDICTNLTHNPKWFWTFIKSKTKSWGVPKFLHSTRQMLCSRITDNKGMSTIFNHFFHCTLTCVVNTLLAMSKSVHN